MSILTVCVLILMGLWVVETVVFCVTYAQTAKGTATDRIETPL